MKLAVPEAMLRAAAVSPAEAVRLGIRYVEVDPEDAGSRPEPADGALRPCLVDTRRSIGPETDPDGLEREAAAWFQAAERWGGAGVAVAVQDVATAQVAETVARLGALARRHGSRLLLAVRPSPAHGPAVCHADLVALCRCKGGIGIVFDAGAEAACGHPPERVLRQAEGYVHHVRLPSPAWSELPPEVLRGVLRELHRMSYIDGVALYGSGVGAQELHAAVAALRDAVRAAWLGE